MINIFNLRININTALLFLTVGLFFLISGIKSTITESKYLETSAELVDMQSYYYQDGTLAYKTYYFQYFAYGNFYSMTRSNRITEYFDNYKVLYNPNNPTEAKLSFEHDNIVKCVIGLAIIGYIFITATPINKTYKFKVSSLVKNIALDMIYFVAIIFDIFYVMSDYRFSILFGVGNEGIVLIPITFIIMIIIYIIADKKEKRAQK